mgnify:CR=1 FL=1
MKKEKKMTRQPSRRPGKRRPSKPADEPGVLVCCKVCRSDKAKTEENFEIYWYTRSGTRPGKYYWRPECRNCHSSPDRMKLVARRDRAEAIVAQIRATENRVPSGQEVARLLGV